MIVAVPPPALEMVLQDIELGPHGVIMLARPDGTILARSGGLDQHAGGKAPCAGRVSPRADR